MNRLNEREIIKIFQSKLTEKFIPEDVEFFKLGKKLCGIKVDTFVESTDMPPTMSLEQAARKSVVACVSDFASKGVKPLYGVVSMTIPNKFTKKSIQKLSLGLASASKEFGIKILGGDTNEGKELVIQFTLIGTSRKIVTRSGAKIGDVIVTSGPFGYSSSGLKILLKNKKAEKNFAKKAKNSVLKPKPKLKFGIKNQKYFSSSMDSSDGLSTTLSEMANQSKKKFVISNLPSTSQVIEFAKKNRMDHLDLILNGGEEYEIVATVSKQNLRKIRKNASLQNIKLYEIGHVTAGRGVFFKNQTTTFRIKNRGWMHFTS